MKRLIKYLYKKYCYAQWRDDFHNEVLELCTLVNYSARNRAYHDLCSRLPLEKVEEFIAEAKKTGTDKYFTLGKLMEKALNP